MPTPRNAVPRVDSPRWLAQIAAGMSAPGRKRVFNYPDQTKGSRLAERVRKEANHLSEPQRAGLLNEAMRIYYGGPPAKKAVRTGR